MKVFVNSFMAALLMLCAGVQGKPLVADSGYAAQALNNCKTDLRYLNQVIGWQVKWPRQWQGIIANGPDTAGEAIKTWSQAPAAFKVAIETLGAGISSKETAPRAVVIRVQQQVRDLLSDLTLANSKYRFNQVEHKNAALWNALIKDEIVPAVSALEKFLDKEYLPAASIAPGLSKLKGGAACFADAVTWWTTLSLSSDEIEAIGRRFLKESQEQLLATGKPGDTVAHILKDLRAETQVNQTGAKDLIVISEKALARAHDKTLMSFSKQITKEIVVSEMPKYLQGSAPAGYYGKAQGKAPARYIINPSRPNERRLMAEVIAFHEGLPGHHLWSTYPREQASTGYNSGILEGWALYSEYLADEMNLYSSIYDRQGMIAKHLWAASRLIVEPGIHLRGWSRKQAIDFMLENTVMSRTEIEIEVDRYIAMPGQSLSYILGADVILSERIRAREIIGDTFDIAAFHDVILKPGVRPLPQVRADIRAWVQREQEIKPI
ncbi:DUF885 domain-containing protein [Thalassomonas actiniarum]|uniref:DUF885 domain-containing protein n=1 Tax=Thalassomonas actiniarum TaxID=485447 RepID=A0AAE9YQ67_9GAMM|nr:DUF885 domain-containing protein [Thalassomonas actiniarum]WDD97532.1 DUF885 domain-containing protein [Thalassomonas actiniarum]